MNTRKFPIYSYYQFKRSIAIGSLICALILPGSAFGLLLTTDIGSQNIFSIVELQVNGFPTRFAVDTGSNVSTIHIHAASALGLADTGTNAAPVTASNFEAGKFAGSIDIGSSLIDMQFGVTDSTIIGTDADGILGSDFLIEKSGGFDLSNNLLTINPDFAVTFVNGRLLVTIPVKGTKGTENLKFVIDTGAPISLLNTTSSEKIGLTEINVGGKPVKVNLKVGGDSGEAPIKAGTIDGLDPSLFIVKDIQGLPDGVVGLLGLDVLDERFQLTVRTDKKTLTIDKPTPPGEKVSSGIDIKYLTVPEPNTLALLGFTLFLLVASQLRPLKKRHYGHSSNAILKA